MIMLEKLNEVDWDNFNGENVPDWVNQLQSSNQIERAIARNKLEEVVIKISHQNFDMGHGISELLSTELPIKITPFLIELLANESTPERVKVLDMLIGLSLYGNMKYEGEIYQHRLMALQQKIYKAKELYISLLGDASSLMRASAFSILIQSPKIDKNLKQQFERTLSKEQDSLAKEFMQKQWAEYIRRSNDDS